MSKLQKIKRKNLDVKKYSKAINEALNYRIYAEYWYLDVLTKERWECWVYGDYDIVMPIPLQYKFGIKFVLQPIFCQQLGVFYKEEIPGELFKAFEKKLHKYRVRAYSFNEENTERYSPKGESKVNYVLDLNRPYEEIRSQYKEKRRKDINRAKNKNLIVEESDEFEVFHFFQKQFYPILNKISALKANDKLIRELRNRKRLKLFYIKYNGDYIGAQIFNYSQNRIYCMTFYRNKDLDKYNTSAFIKNYLIEKEANKYLKLDFDGSMISGVASFIEGFGAEKKHYKTFSNFNVFYK